MFNVYWTGVEAGQHENLTLAAVPPPTLAAGGLSLSGYLDTTRRINIVIYRDRVDNDEGFICDIYWSTGPASFEDISGAAGTPLAVGTPSAYYSARNDTHQITYRTSDGRLYELWWVGIERVSGYDLSARSRAPMAAGDPVAYYNAATDTKHVIYRSDNNHLNEIRWVPGGVPSHIDLTVEATNAGFNVPPAAGSPAAFAVEGSNNHHVAYRTTDNEIYEIFWK
jgi:hypothetical protein